MRVAVKFVVLGMIAALLALSPVTAGAVTAAPSGLVSTGTGTTWQLSWSATPGASAYKIDIATNENFSTLLESTTTYARTHTPRIDLRGASERVVYWRVAAFASGTTASTQSIYSDVARVDIGRIGAPRLTTPASGATINYPAPVSFAWDPVPGAVSYEIEYTPPSGTPVSTTVTSTVFAPTTTLTRGDYTWRVRATTFSSAAETNTSGWSEASTFSVAWREADSRVRLLSPVLLLPAVSDPEFRWQAVPGAAFYKIAIYGDEAKTNVFTPPTDVFGTSFVPPKVMLNGPYFWEVTAYDTLGVPGAPQESLTQITKRWGNQAAATQPGDASVDAAPVPLKWGTTTPLASGEGTLFNPEEIPLEEFELSWTPIPRATFYLVNASPVGEGNGGTWTCRTASTSITGSMFYAGGAQLPTHAAGSSHCRGATGNTNRLAEDQLYRWDVQGIDYNGDQTTILTAAIPGGTVVSAPSEPKYVLVTGGVQPSGVGDDCTESTPIGGCVDLDVSAFHDQEGMSQGSSGQWDGRTPAPRMEWAPIEDAIGYEVRIYRGAGTTTHVATFRTEQTVLRPNGVFKDDNTGEPYSFRVLAIMEGNLATGAGITYPVEPTWEQAEHLEWRHTSAAAEFENDHAVGRDGAVLLRWKPQFAVDPLFGGNRGYQVSYKQAGTSAWTNVKVEYPFWIAQSGNTPLPAGTYDVRVAPLDANGDVGRPTEARQFSVAPQIPPSVTARAVGSQSALVEWAPAAVAEGYQVRWKRRDTATWTAASTGNNLSTTQTVFAINALRPADYDFSVRARTKGNNWSAWSDEVGATVAPVSVRPLIADGAIFSGDGRVVEWEPVAGASRYAVQVATTEAGVDAAAPTEVVGTKMSVSGAVQWATRYYWRVTALAEPKLNNSAVPATLTNRVVLGTSAVRSYFTRAIPAAPVLSATVGVVDADALNLSWTELSGQAAGSDLAPTYIVRHRLSGQVPEAEWTELRVDNATTVTVTGLRPAAEYEFQLAAANGEGQSAWSAVRKQKTPVAPGAPTSPKLLTNTATSFELQWGAPKADGGTAITGYVVRWKEDTASTWSTQEVAASPATVTGLKESTLYNVQVVALNRAGESAPAAINVSTFALPGAPTSVTTKPGNRSVATSWTPPTRDGGQKIVGYEVWARPANGVWTRVGTPANPAFKHGGITNGKKYEYRVATVTAAGVGPYSRAASQVSGVPSKPKVTVKSMKGRILVKPSGGAANGSKITSYTVQVSTNGIAWKKLKKTKKTVTYKKSKKGKTVYFRAIATNKFGSSNPSAAKSGKKK